MAKMYTCSVCAFQVRAEDDAEVSEVVRNHARRKHDMEMDDAEVREDIQEVQIG